MNKIILFVAVSLTLAGCAGPRYAAKHYGYVPVIKHKTDHGTFRVHDKPSDNRLMITPTIGASIAGGMVEGVSLGTAQGFSPISVYRAAAESYLSSTQRDCTITDGYLIYNPQWEFLYTCQPAGQAD